MHEEYSKFLKLLRPVSKFSFDTSLSEVEEDELQRPFNISPEEFLKEMYEPREVEQTITEFMRTSTDLLCLVGPKGCGKSSMGLKIASDLELSRFYKSFVVFIDIRMDGVLEALGSKSREAFNVFLKERIRTEYLRRLFPYPRYGKDNPNIQLLSFLLERQPDNIMPSKTFYRFHNLQDKAAQLIREYEEGNLSKRKNVSYFDWLIATHKNDNNVKKILGELKAIIEIPHLSYAARHIYGFSRQVIWLDNIDAISEGLQREAVETLRGFMGTISAYATCVIAVREENVFKEDDLADEGGPPYLTRVVMQIPRDEAGHAQYPAVDIPVVAADVLKRIVTKRIQFARQYQQKQAKKIESDLQTLTLELGKATADSEKKDIERKKEERQVELRDYSPEISNERYNSLRELSDKVLTVLDSEKGIYLANNSIRDLLFMHRDFLAFLLRAPDEEKEPPMALGYEDWRLATLFLIWVRNVQRTYQIGMYDILDECDKWYKSPGSRIGCLLPHLVVTTIWNLSLEKKAIDGRRLKNVRVKEVIERLSRIGYGRNEVLDCMFSLCYHNGSKGNFLELKVDTDLTNSGEIKDEHVVRITYRAKAFVGIVSSSFGYMYECIRHRTYAEGHLLTHPSMTSTAEHAEEMLPYLCDIAQMHYKEFKRIVQRGTLGPKEDALNNYYLLFGVPQVSPYRRKPQIGIQFHEVARALHFETIISSILSYVRTGMIEKDLRTLQKLFINAMNGVGKLEKVDPDIEEINFREKLGLIARSDSGPESEAIRS